MASQKHHHPHFIFIPLMAQGHMIPMVDMARLFAKRGVLSTIITTPFNAARFMTNMDEEIESGLPIQLVQLPFPSREAGLPDGCENYDTLPSPDMVKHFFNALFLLRHPIEQFLEGIQPVPNCIISDVCFPWTSETARSLGIPRLVFQGICCYSLLFIHNLSLYKPFEKVASVHESFVVPGLHHRIEITKAQCPIEIVGKPPSDVLGDRIEEGNSTCYGVVTNSFHELEPEYVEKYRETIGKKVWTVGPVSLCNKETSDKATRGNKASISESQCLAWLNSKEENSVVYACFGTVSYVYPSQLIEIGLGLEASERPFIWVIRRNGDLWAEVEKWLEEGFEERVKERCLIIRGWAPQLLILSHPAIGGFLTHCGWNSTLEGICAGVPMLTWPFFAEQFFNEKWIVQVLRIGVSVGVKATVNWGQEEVGEIVKKEEVATALERLMDEGEEGEERRKRATELGEKAKRAMEEGGSSYINMTLLIEEVMDHFSEGMNLDNMKSLF